MKWRSTLGAGAAVGSARLFSLVCALVQLPVLTRVLDLESFAAVSVAMALAVYFNLVASEPVILGFERFPGDPDLRGNYRYAFTRTSALLAVATLALILIAIPLGKVEEAIALAGWAMGLAVNRLVSQAWLMWGRPWQYSINLIAGTGVRTLVLVLLIVNGVNPLVSLAAAGAASAVAALSISPRFARSGVPPEVQWRIGFGINLAVAALALALLTSGNLLILTPLLPADRVGVYAAMTQIAAYSSAAALNLLLAVTYPGLRRAWDEGRRSEVARTVSALQLLCITVACGAIAATYAGDLFVVKLLVPAPFVDPQVLSTLLIATAAATMGSMASWQHQLALEAATVSRRTAMAAALGLAMTVALAFVWHERGAALGSALGFTAYLLIMQRGSRLPWSNAVALVVAAAATSAGLAFPSESAWVALPAAVVAVLSAAWAWTRFRRPAVSIGE